MRDDAAAPARTARARLGVGGLVLLHLVLGLAVQVSPAIAIMHFVATTAAAVLVAYSGQTGRVLGMLGYIAAAEVLWRMSDVGLPWEGAKYLCVLTAALGLLRSGGLPRQWPLPAAYLLPLTVSLVVPLADAERTLVDVVDDARFYLAAPAALAFSVMLGMKARADDGTARAVLLATVLPVVATGGFTLGSILGAEAITFTSESNFVTSGGFGPNQVSGILGLGAMVALILGLLPATGARLQQVLLAGVSVALGAAAILTFSRGGVLAAVLALVAAAPFLLRDRAARWRFLAAAAVVVVVMGAYVVPRLEAFTGGALGDRYAERSFTNRDVLMRDDLVQFANHPVFGVGPGMSGSHRTLIDHGIGHTEFTRMLAEHGTPGLISLISLLFIGGGAALLPGNPVTRGARVALVVWAFLTMTHMALRLVSPTAMLGLAWGLLQGPLVPDDEAEAGGKSTGHPR